MWTDISRYQRRYWGQTLSALFRCYGVVLDAQLAIAQQTLQATADAVGAGTAVAASGEETHSKAGDSVAAIAEAVERRVGAGLSPPPEAHLVPYRNKIDWSRYPDWARPADPDMFDGSGHEG